MVRLSRWLAAIGKQGQPYLFILNVLTPLIWVMGVPSVSCAQNQIGPRVQLRIGQQAIEAELADNDAARQRGLMFRRTLPERAGMLFVFDMLDTHCMWMRNTPLPLSVAFLDETGEIINIEDMQPLSDAIHCARRPARYALEMNQGWFAMRGLGKGGRVLGITTRPGSKPDTIRH